MSLPHLDDLLKRPAAMKAEIVRLRSEVQRLPEQVAAAEQRAERAERGARDAWILSRQLRHGPWTPPR